MASFEEDIYMNPTAAKEWTPSTTWGSLQVDPSPIEPPDEASALADIMTPASRGPS